MESYTILELIGIILSIIIAVGGSVYGFMIFVSSSTNDVKSYADSEIDKLRKIMVENDKDVTRRLDATDLWKKEMNGQLKTMNAKHETTNNLIIEQKEHLLKISDSISSITTTLAVLGEAFGNIKVSFAKQDSEIDKIYEKLEKLEERSK